MDKTTTLELLEFILESITLIKRRFKNIKVADDFLHTDDGLDKLDSIAMRVQAIGEALKNIHKRDKEFLLQVATSEYWSQIIKARDFISHHYVELDSETIFEICDAEIEKLEQKTLQLKSIL